MTAGPLTARGVKVMLTRSGIDWATAGLTVTDERGGVFVRGPGEWRGQAFQVLLDRGLSCAPYPDRDEYRRIAADGRDI